MDLSLTPLLVLGLTSATKVTSTTIHRLIRQDINSTTCLFTITFDIVSPEVAQPDFRYALTQALEAEYTNQIVNLSVGTVRTPNNDDIRSYNTTFTISVEEETPEELSTFAEGLVGQTLGEVKVGSEQAEYTIHAVSCNDLD